jgi:hypothetical protein
MMLRGTFMTLCHYGPGSAGAVPLPPRVLAELVTGPCLSVSGQTKLHFHTYHSHSGRR